MRGVAAASAAAAGAVALGTYLWLKGRTSAPPDYDDDTSTWFAHENDGTKPADETKAI